MVQDNFSGNRFSTFTDLKTREWEILFNEMKVFSDHYLELLRNRNLFPSDYCWPKNALMTNTRVWEYPYVVHALNKYSNKGEKLLDIGSALTFLPYYLSKIGYEVYAIDCNEQMVKWSENIRISLNSINTPGFEYKPLLSYTYGDVTELNFTDESFNIITNVSVLEHLPFDSILIAVNNIYRILKKGGIFICTLDCLVSGQSKKEHMPLNDIQFRKFTNILLQKFELVEENVISSPDALLTNKHALNNSVICKKRSFVQRLKIAKRVIFNSNRIAEDELVWTAFGIILRK